MKKTLLEIAKETSIARKIRDEDVNDEDIELVFAWIRREVASKQVSAAKGWKINEVSRIGLYVSKVVQQAYLRGVIKLPKKTSNEIKKIK